MVDSLTWATGGASGRGERTLEEMASKRGMSLKHRMLAPPAAPEPTGGGGQWHGREGEACPLGTWWGAPERRRGGVREQQEGESQGGARRGDW